MSNADVELTNKLLRLNQLKAMRNNGHGNSADDAEIAALEMQIAFLSPPASPTASGVANPMASTGSSPGSSGGPVSQADLEKIGKEVFDRTGWTEENRKILVQVLNLVMMVETDQPIEGLPEALMALQAVGFKPEQIIRLFAQLTRNPGQSDFPRGKTASTFDISQAVQSLPEVLPVLKEAGLNPDQI